MDDGPVWREVDVVIDSFFKRLDKMPNELSEWSTSPDNVTLSGWFSTETFSHFFSLRSLLFRTATDLSLPVFIHRRDYVSTTY